MTLTELLITGFDGDEACFAATVTPEEARAIFVQAAQDGTPVVSGTVDQAGEVFARLSQLLH